MTRTASILKQLRAYESRNVTYFDADGSWPIVWERARGVHVWDAEERKYLDLTAAFGVAAAGHANPRVVRAGQRQMAKLLHAMGDVHPHELKVRLARELSRVTFERWGAEIPKSEIRNPKSAKTIFCNSGFEAVEAALKTALLATGRRGVIAFEGGYHGLGYGALNATHREHFRAPFRSQLREFGHFVPFSMAGAAASFSAQHRPTGRDRQDACPTMEAVEAQVRRCFRRHSIGAVIAEPVQARGGINVPPPEFLPMLRRVCDEHGALLILDEIYTGFGRTGKWFACEHSGVTPDLICLGKALTGGFPLSACVGRADVMDAAWPVSAGEAIHTSTFLGHPVGCAMALAQIAELRRLRLVERSARLGRFLLAELEAVLGSGFLVPSSEFRVLGSEFQGPSSALPVQDLARGVGLMVGLELRHADGSPATDAALRAVKAMLGRGFILLPEGECSNVLGFTPPLTITEAQLRSAVAALAQVLATKRSLHDA